MIDYVAGLTRNSLCSLWLGEALAVANLELGLRWLNDRTRDKRAKNKSKSWQDPSGRWFG